MAEVEEVVVLEDPLFNLPVVSHFWVQDWVQLKKEEWFRSFCKRHQIGHLDF